MTENELRQWLEDGCPQLPHKYRCELCDEGTHQLINSEIDGTHQWIQICRLCSSHLGQLNWDHRFGPFHYYYPIEEVQKTKQLLSQWMNSKLI